jgi:DNA-binding transcriptional regulator YiaG
MNSMGSNEMVGTGVPLPRIEKVSFIAGRRLHVVWTSGETHDVDVTPALLSHRSFVALRSDDALFATAARDEYGDAVVWADGSELSATWLYELAEPASLSNDEFRSAMDSLHMSLDGMAVRLGIARRLVADYRKDRPIPRTVALATRHLMERTRPSS